MTEREVGELREEFTRLLATAPPERKGVGLMDGTFLQLGIAIAPDRIIETFDEAVLAISS